MYREDVWLECMELRTRKAGESRNRRGSVPTNYLFSACPHKAQAPGAHQKTDRETTMVKYLASCLPTLLYGNFIRLPLVLRHLSGKQTHRCIVRTQEGS